MRILHRAGWLIAALGLALPAAAQAASVNAVRLFELFLTYDVVSCKIPGLFIGLLAPPRPSLVGLTVPCFSAITGF